MNIKKRESCEKKHYKQMLIALSNPDYEDFSIAKIAMSYQNYTNRGIYSKAFGQIFLDWFNKKREFENRSALIRRISDSNFIVGVICIARESTRQ